MDQRHRSSDNYPSSDEEYESSNTNESSEGLTMLSLLEGDVVPPSKQDFFARWSSSQLLKHSFNTPPPSLNFFANVPETINSERDQSGHVNQNGKLADDSEDILEQFIGVNVVDKSRFNSEFEVLDCLGKGGFGSVVKVRHYLDKCLYAIKKIPLSPNNHQINNEKIREVKLLSRLNHENIVRYFSSWIDDEEAPELSKSSSSEKKSSVPEEKEKPAVEDSLMQFNVIEAPCIRQSVEEEDSWASGNTKTSEHESDSYSSSDEEDEIPKPKQSSNTNESSEDIMFKKSIEESSIQFGKPLASEEEESDFESVEETTATESSQDLKPQLQCLYIQMELCEKTLRSVIDEGLYKNQQRIWRLLREIVEGLVHVHSQGIIHRDLKPVNIFLDSNDRVKIGDFGLATTHHAHDSSPAHESMTGEVGTPLYVAPELGGTRYTQKVDLYSLGIIFFEMCYKPLKTTVERIEILEKLRTKEIQLPEDFDTGLDQQTLIIRRLLLHNPDQRPTSEELLNRIPTEASVAHPL